MAHLLGDDNLVADALTRRAQLQYDQGDFQTSARILTDSLELARKSGGVAQQVEALRLLAYVAIQEGHLFRALDCTNRALNIIPKYEGNSFYLKARSLAVKGYALIHMSQLDEAASPLAEALVLFRRLSKRRNESQMMWHLSLLAQARGELIEAIEFIESALRIDVQVRGERPRGRKLAALAAIRAEIGDFQGAYADIERSETICLENRELVGIAEAGLTKARLKILEGNATQAIQILEQVGKHGVVEQSRLLLVRHRQLSAMAYLLAGRLDTARKLAAEASRVSLKAGLNGEAVHGGALQGLILAEMGLDSEALSTTRRATDLLAMVGKVRRAEEVWWFQALTFQKAGNSYRAERSLEEAHNEVERKRALINDPRLAVLYDNHPLVRRIRDGVD
jgi:tetratricopeptide (TPR) repeat protein